MFSTIQTKSKQSVCVTEVAQVANKEDLEEIRVDMAEMKVDNRPVHLVACVGSCIAICIYDSSSRMGGMAHVMLPQADVFPQEDLPAKFADTAVPALTKAIKNSRTDCVLSAKIAGGANMFPNIRQQSLAIGTKNIEDVKNALRLNKIPLLGEDVAGTQGRKVTFNTTTGRVIVRLLNGEVKQL